LKCFLHVYSASEAFTAQNSPLSLVGHQVGPRGRREHEFYETIRAEKDACVERQTTSGGSLGDLQTSLLAGTPDPSDLHRSVGNIESP